MFDGRIISGITVFVKVAEAGSYARASDQVGLSPSGVGKAIARLEERTGFRLFDRTSRAFKLTAEGRLFLKEVKPLLERLGAAASPRNSGDMRGHLRISCDASFGVYLLMPAIGGLIERHPHLKVDLMIRDRIENMIADGFDCAIRFGEPEFGNLEKRFLFTSRVITCASPAYLGRRGVPLQPVDLLTGHDCIRLMDDLTGRPLVWNLENEDGHHHAISPDCSLIVNDAPSLLSGVKNGVGIVRALDFMVAAELGSGDLVEVLPSWNRRPWPAYIYTPERAHRSPALDAFIDFVAETFGAVGPQEAVADRGKL